MAWYHGGLARLKDTQDRDTEILQDLLINRVHGQNCYLRMALLLLLLLILSSSESLSDKTIHASRIDEPIYIDGRLDESAWSRTDGTNDFIQQEPNEGQPTTLHTEVRVLYDTNTLYIGFVCNDSQPDRIMANEMRRDGLLWQNDSVYILLDTYGDRRQAFFFRTNARGARLDAAVSDDGQNINSNWDCIWEAAGEINQEGWTVEVAIPFNQLRFTEKPSMTWGVNFGRDIMRTNEKSQWVPVPRSESWQGTYRPVYQGNLVGLEGIHSPSHLNFKPYLLGGIEEQFVDEDMTRNGTGDLGLDVKYGITPNLTLDMTANTDFAQVEADAEQVNLTRFSLFLPEKRDFFLEGSGLYTFAARSGRYPLSLFYSRRIGIEESQQVRILGGGKLSGKVGNYSIGALNMMTESRSDSPLVNFSVLRVKRDIFDSSNIGVIFTNRQSGLGSGYNRSGGIELALQPDDQWKIYGITAGTSSDAAGGTDRAVFLSNDWRNDYLHINASYLDIGPDFMTEMGYVRRANIRHFNLATDLTRRLRNHKVREMGVFLTGNYLLDHDNMRLGREMRIGGNMIFNSGDNFRVTINQSFDRVEEDFQVQDAHILAGDYDLTSISLSAVTSTNRPFSVEGRVNYGDYFHGRVLSFGVYNDWRITYQLAIETRYDHNWINLPEINFRTNVFRTRIMYALNPDFFSKLYVQYNDSRDRLSVNFLIDYIYRPGSNFYLVYNQAWNASDGLRSQTWTVLSKFTYYFSL